MVTDSTGTVAPLPPNQAAKDAGVTQASKTASTGAANVRVMKEPAGSVMGGAFRGVGEVVVGLDLLVGLGLLVGL